MRMKKCYLLDSYFHETLTEYGTVVPLGTQDSPCFAFWWYDLYPLFFDSTLYYPKIRIWVGSGWDIFPSQWRRKSLEKYKYVYLVDVIDNDFPAILVPIDKIKFLSVPLLLYKLVRLGL